MVFETPMILTCFSLAKGGSETHGLMRPGLRQGPELRGEVNTHPSQSDDVLSELGRHSAGYRHFWPGAPGCWLPTWPASACSVLALGAGYIGERRVPRVGTWQAPSERSQAFTHPL